LKNSLTFLSCTIATISLLLSSCGNGSDTTIEGEAAAATETTLSIDQALRINLFTEPPTLDPGKATDSTSFHVLKMMFEGLTRIQPDGKPAPAAADQIEVSADLKMYRFTLRDAKWSNGDPVTAYDFEHAWKEVLRPGSDAPYAYQLYAIKNGEDVKKGKATLEELGIEVVDDKTLVVTLENPTPYFLELTAFCTYYPINKNVTRQNQDWSQDAGENYVSNGPFTLSSWQHHNKLEVVKNPNYWDAKNVRLDKISMVMISDTSTELSMFENEELHWAGRPISRLPADAIPSLRRDGKLNSQAVAGIEWYKFNTGRFPFNNIKMRKAFTIAINRKVIIEQLMPDNHKVATGLVPTPLTLQESPFFPDGDVEQARQLFEEALVEIGITKDDLPSISLSYNSNEAHHRLAQAVQQQWFKTFGVRVILEASEWKVHISKLRKHDYQIARLGWVADFRDPINFLEVFRYKNDPIAGGNNDTQWENPEYARLLEESSGISDPDDRKTVLHQAETLIMNEMPVAPIYFMMDNYVKDPKLKGAYLSGLGDVDFKWAYFENHL
jgi:oligopeptide transport system substrate-binding protein